MTGLRTWYLSVKPFPFPVPLCTEGYSYSIQLFNHFDENLESLFVTEHNKNVKPKPLINNRIYVSVFQ